MNRQCFLAFVLSSTSLLCGASCAPERAAASEAAAHAHDTTSTTVFGERLLLFVEYPHLVRGVPARFLAHFTVLADGEPVRAGNVTLEIGASRLSVDAPEREGLFIPVGSLPEAGTFAARIVVKSSQAEEILDLGTIVVHADADAADRAAHAAEGDEPADAVPFLMEPQWRVKLLLAQAAPRRLDVRLTLPARAVVPEDRAAVVTPLLAGRLSAPAGSRLARSGDVVTAGQTLGFVEPPLGAAEVAQLHALDLEFDLKALDVLRASGEAETRVRFAERERERIAKLRDEGLGTQQQLEAAQQDLALARTELDAATRTRQALGRLIEKRRVSGGADAGAPLRLPLTAPIAGMIVETRAVAGSTVAPDEPVFRILDRSRLWIEGRLSEFDAGHLEGPLRAVARFTALAARHFELEASVLGRPRIGAEVDSESRTLLLRYELDNAEGAVRPGMLAEIDVSIGQRDAKVAIPHDGVVMDQGLATAYVMLEGELFQKRELELGVRDGDWIEILRGLEPGERVATRGAYLVKLAALAPASFGHGHAH